MRHLLCTLLASATLVGCSVGPPDPVTVLPLPPAPAPETITAASGPAQHLAAGDAAVPAWWTGFASTKLDVLVTQALAGNNDLAAAESNLRQAREQANATASGQGPQIDANYQAQHAEISRTLATPLADADNYLYTLNTAQVTVSYPLDLFGAGRSKVQSARSAAKVAADRLAAVRAATVANLVLAVIQHAALAAEIDATRSAIENNRELVTLLRRRQAIGDVGESDVSAQEAALAAAEVALPPLQRQVEHQLGVIEQLLGHAPGGAAPDLPALAELHLPTTLPLALPSDIVTNRPDVQAAAAQVKGAAADLRTSAAARLPSFQLTGNAGGSALHFLDMFASGNPFFAVLGSVTQPVFHSGQLRHQQRAAAAALDVAQAQYRAAAIQAFLDVDDALTGLRTDAVALDAASRADAAATRTLVMTRRQVELGALGTLQLLNASAAAAQTAVQRIQAEAARLSDTVALFQACGTNPVDFPGDHR
jgi:NodT family efflux transporter outer membrane factor (OMF) lipoprotein